MSGSYAQYMFFLKPVHMFSSVNVAILSQISDIVYHNETKTDLYELQSRHLNSLTERKVETSIRYFVGKETFVISIENNFD